MEQAQCERQRNQGHQGTSQTAHQSECTRKGGSKQGSKVDTLPRMADQLHSGMQTLQRKAHTSERVEDVVADLFLAALKKNPEMKSNLSAMTGQLVRGGGRRRVLTPGVDSGAAATVRLPTGRVNGVQWTSSGQLVKDLGTPRVMGSINGV